MSGIVLQLLVGLLILEVERVENADQGCVVAHVWVYEKKSSTKTT